MAMRRQLSGNYATEQPRSHIFLDTETIRTQCESGGNEFTDTLRCWYSSHVTLDRNEIKSEVHGSGPPRNFWAWLQSRVLRSDGTTWIWAHNAGYDFRVLDGFKAIERGLYAPDFMAIDGSTFILSGSKLGHKICWVNSTGWLRMSLVDVARNINHAYVALPGVDASHDQWISRCRNDVSILQSAILTLLRWHRRSDLGCLRFTAAAQAMQFWRHRAGPRIPASELSPRQVERVNQDGRAFVYPIIHSSEQALIAEREAYYGPTNVCYMLGRVNEPIYSLDVQSAYPAWMGANAFPICLISRMENVSIARLRALLRDYGAVAWVKLRDADCEYPVRTAHGTIRATGTYWTVLPGPELRHAIESGFVAECALAFLYDERKIFRLWSKWVCSERASCKASSNSLVESVVKTLANSLHGKFGQRSPAWIDVEGERSEQSWGVGFHVPKGGGPAVMRRYISGKIQESQSPTEHVSSYPAIPAWVNSYARLEMRRLRNIAGISETYYCYTDSLHVSRQGFNNLVDAGEVLLGEPGKLKVDAVYDWCHYYAPGRYETSAGRNCAGLSRDYWIDDDGDCAHWRYTNAAEQVSSFLRNGEPISGVSVRKEKYSLNESACGRIVGKDNWTYAPILGG